MTRQKPNRGVVLLVVLSLLTLFVVVGLTFIVVAGQYRRTSVAAAKRKKLQEQPEKLTDLALYQLLRGTPGVRTPSSLHGWDLLGDLYGNDGVRGVVRVAAAGAAQDFTTIRFDFSALTNQPFGRHPSNPLHRQMLLDDYFNGRVITFLTGPLAGRSSRVVDYFLTAGPDGVWGAPGDDDFNGTPEDYSERGDGDDQFFLRVETFSSDGATTGLPATGDVFLINGRPFNGTGNGYLDVSLPFKGMATATNNLDAVAYDRGPDGRWGVAGNDDDANGVTDDSSEAGWLGSDDTPINMALAPHFGFYPGGVQIGPDLGGQDEPYDAVDYQNMFLGMVTPDPTGLVIPSFHRPALINFWARHPNPAISGNWTRSPPGNPDLWKEFRRRVIFRPMPWDHPYFSGGNRALALTPGTADWDMTSTDGAPGVAGVDDDQNGLVDDIDELGWPGSDDRLTAAAEQRILTALLTGNNYDVDNDADGRKDSIWIDIGLPVKTAPDGRQYKPLVAILCQDMDGRLNANAHGQLAHIPGATEYGIWGPGPDGRPGRAGVDDDGDGNMDNASEFGALNSDDVYGIKNATLPVAGNTRAQLLYPDPRTAYRVSNAVPLPRGRGEGPAEISLMPAFWGAFRDAQALMVARSPGGVTANNVLLNPNSWSKVHHQGAPAHHFQSLLASPALPVPPLAGLGVAKRPGRANRDFWHPGPDGNWGRAGVDDNGNGTVDEYLEAGWSQTDDFHYNTAFGNPSDIRGLGSLGLDLVGNNYYTDQGLANEYLNNPYVFSPEGNSLSDAGSPRFSAEDLEGMLRVHDIDAKLLRSRLLDAAPSLRGGSQAAAYRRNILTTHSSHIPTPPTGIAASRRGTGLGAWPYLNFRNPATGTPELRRSAQSRSPHILDLYVDRLLRNGIRGRALQRELNKIVPFEMRHGLKFDVNRPFGNGIDDNLNDVVDDPSEWVAGGSFTETAYTSHQAPSTFGRTRFQHRNGGTNTLDPRVLYARHLYCLMMLLAEEGYIQPFLDQNEELELRQESQRRYGNRDYMLQEVTAQRIAQWAVNVVDFRDSDAIMTGFEYDVNPFDGWDVDGWLAWGPGGDGAWGRANVDDDGNGVVDDQAEAGANGSDDVNEFTLQRPPRGALEARLLRQRRVVWGVESPDLMMTETKAFHNVRTKDSDKDDDDQKRLNDNPNRDDDSDQYRIPQGSLFIELYCPANRPAHDPRMPAELYDLDGNLDLNRLAPGKIPNRPYPVWQVLIARANEDTDPDKQTPLDRVSSMPTTVDFDPGNMRIIQYPTTPNPGGGPGGGGPGGGGPPGGGPPGGGPPGGGPPGGGPPGGGPNPPGRRGPPPWANNLPEDAMDIDRIIWFVRRNGANSIDVTQYGDNIYQHFGNWNPKLPPGHYAMVAPRPFTRITNLTSVANDVADLPPQALIVNPTNGLFTAVDYQGNPAVPANVKPVISVVAAMPPRVNWTNVDGDIPQFAQDWGLGVSISEPLPSSNDYYRPPDFEHPLGYGPDLPDDYYYDEKSAAMGMMPGNTMPDVPFDGDDPGARWQERPLRNGDGDNFLQDIETHQDVRTAFLQRLANPKSPWNPPWPHPEHSPAFPVNPYITVDWASIDLTVYNGEDRNNDDALSDPNPGVIQFGSRQRGRFNGSQPLNFFTPVAQQAPNTSQQGAGSGYAFRYQLAHTFGYLNNSDPPGTPPAMLNRRREGTPFSTTGISMQYMGDPANPLPTIWWNNRPFANALELLQVPSSTPGRFFFEFKPNRAVAAPPVEYEAYNEHPGLSQKRRFYHLLNFFSSYSYDPSTNAPRVLTGAGGRTMATGAHFYRLFDYVETPSPFVSTRKWLNPTTFSLPPLPGPDGRWGRRGVDDNFDGVVDDIGEVGWPGSDDINVEQEGFRPPFNRISKQRDPGKVNLNTIPITPPKGPDGGFGFAGVDDNGVGAVDDPAEFGAAGSDDFRAGPLEGILKGFPALDNAAFASRFHMSRRGYHTVRRDDAGTYVPTVRLGNYGVGGFSDPLALDPYYPTRFANPFRPAWATSLMPELIRLQLGRDGLLIAKNHYSDTPLIDPTTGFPFLDEVQGTILRRDSLTPERAGPDGSPGTLDDIYRAEPLFVPDDNALVNAPWRDQRRNHHHRYHALQRIANLTSTTSNVYAVWITVGFFEVEPVHRRTQAGFEVPESHPDGYRLGRELGSDVGDVRRHRAFYIIDRSIPVAYEPGENHNVDRAIMVRRLIE